jgi:predicted Fe-Mo cluster-binding NifX family protein
MKIAVPTRNNMVDDHFGHCEYFTLFTISNNNTIEHEETVYSSGGCGCKSNLAALLRNKGVSTILTGNIGEGAINMLKAQGIDVIRGCSGNVRKTVQDYLEGIIVDSGVGCGHHHHHHENHGECHHNN